MKHNFILNKIGKNTYQVDVEPELPDEVEILQVILAGLVVGARVRLELDVG